MSGLRCTVKGCKTVINAWTGLQELEKLRAHMRRVHLARWSLHEALENRVVMEKQNADRHA